MSEHYQQFAHAIQLFSCLKIFLISFSPTHPLCRSCSSFRGVWYEHDVTSDDEAEENQDPIAEDQHDEGSGDELDETD